MANKEIKQRIVLEGEKQYNQAIKEAQRNLRTLKSELKAETAELGKNATEQQKAEAKARSLKAQIAEQEKIVKTLRAALEEAKKEYGDNADEIAKWEVKLNNARTVLAGMKNDLEGVGQGFRQNVTDAQMGTVAAKSYADSLGKIADAGGAVADRVESIFRGMVDVVSEAIGAVWEDMVDLAGRANSWVDLAGFWNTDAATIQKWTHAVEGAHNSVDDLNNAVTRINMGDQKKIAEATGVSGENYTDKWAYAMAVMDKMAAMDYESMLEAAGEVFGEKRATKVMDLLNDWGTIQANLAKFDPAAGGIGMTEEQIQNMSSLAERVDVINVTWRAFLDSFEAEHLGKLALDLTGNAQRILEDLIAYLDTGSDEDLAKLEEDITAFFDRVVEALEAAAGKLDEAGKKLSESDNGIVRAIGGALQNVAGALKWISDSENIDKVVKGFEALAAFFLVGKGAQLAGSVASLAANLALIKGFGAGGGAAAAGAEATAGGAESAAAGLTSNALTIGTGFAGLAAIVAGFNWATDRRNNHREEVLGTEENLAASAGRNGELMDTFAEWASLKNQAENLDIMTATAEEVEEIYGRIGGLWEKLESMEGFDSLWDSYSAWRQENGMNSMDWSLPASWWKNPSGAGSGADENGITSADLQGFRGLPSQLQIAVQKGAASGVSGLRVEIDGQTAGRILAPYVSQEIAKAIP